MNVDLGHELEMSICHVQYFKEICRFGFCLSLVQYFLRKFLLLICVLVQQVGWGLLRAWVRPWI